MTLQLGKWFMADFVGDIIKSPSVKKI